jgi:hypothetical protein
MKRLRVLTLLLRARAEEEKLRGLDEDEVFARICERMKAVRW